MLLMATMNTEILYWNLPWESALIFMRLGHTTTNFRQLRFVWSHMQLNGWEIRNTGNPFLESITSKTRSFLQRLGHHALWVCALHVIWDFSAPLKRPTEKKYLNTTAWVYQSVELTKYIWVPNHFYSSNWTSSYRWGKCMRDEKNSSCNSISF